jgi:outer membrane protein OmpA-like peptidoglycan-associated protein
MRSRLLVLGWSLCLACGACGGVPRGEVTAVSEPARDDVGSRSEPAEENERDPAALEASAPPADTDGDAIADAVDACPEEAEIYNGRDDADGCPECGGSVVLTDVWELPRVEFVEATTLLHTWELDFTAAVILAHAEYAQVEVAGSARRGERDPRALSSARAELVREGLIARGVPPERLVTSVRGVTDDGARVRFVVTREGSAYPLCNTPFPGCDASALSLHVIDSVWFAAGSATIEERHAPILDQVASTVSSVPAVEPLEVLGYVGPGEPRPRALALARATAVLDALVARGLPRDRLLARDSGRHELREPGGVVRFGRLIPATCRGIAAPEERAR